MNIASALLLAISANLDTFAVAVSYGLKKVKLSFHSIILIAFITSIGTLLSMYLGKVITNFISLQTANLIGSIMLILIGIWFIIGYFREETVSKSYCKCCENKSTYCDICKILSDPIKADKDNSGDIDFKECLTLSIALSLNNVGLGISASIAGINIYLNTLFTFIVTLLGFWIGGVIGRSYFSKICGEYSSLASGILITLIGISQIFI